MNKVELENITVRYGDHTVLDNFSLTIPEGKIIGIVGPSACGKTTVVRAICGFVNPQTGTVKINGNTMYSKEQKVNIAPERRNVGVDAKLREQLLVEIRLMQERLGSTIIYITHDQEAALQLCDKIVIMQNDGSIGQIGTDEEIIKDPANKFIFKFIGVSNFLPVKMEDGKCYLDYSEPMLLCDHKPEGYPDTDKPVEMGVRPMDVIFDDASPIKAKIIQTVFLGNIYNYFIQLGGQELRVQRITSGDEEDEKYVEGKEVGIRFVGEKYYTREEKADV